MVRMKAGAWVHGLVDHKFIVPHVVGKPVEHQFVVEQFVESLLQRRLIHDINIRDSSVARREYPTVTLDRATI